MNIARYAATAGHVLAALAAVLLAAYMGRRAAGRLRQPGVVAEIAVGLLIAPLIFAVGGHHVLAVLLPPKVVGALRDFGNIGLELFLVGVARDIRTADFPGRRALTRVTAGALLLPLASGCALGAWVQIDGDPALRGRAPAAELVLLLAAAMMVTAVPVLARILADSGQANSEVARLAMASAVVTDVVAWLLLALVIGLTVGLSVSSLVPAATAVGTTVGAVLAARLLRRQRAGRLTAAQPWLTAVLIAVAALTASDLTQRGGLTNVFGALAVGFAIPAESRWGTAAGLLSGLGGRLVPVYFVSTGIAAFSIGLTAVPWGAIVVATVLATVGKVLGGYVGARSTGKSQEFSLRLGVLLNTRGLTELVVLQAGYSLHIFTADLFAAMIVMTLVTTAMTGPACMLLARRRAPRRSEASRADFRALMAAFPSGVAIVTATGGGGTPYGMTCSSLCSVAITPPTLLICLRDGSPTLTAVLSQSAFTVNLLHHQAQSTAELFASGAPNRFERIAWHRDDHAAGPHLIDDAHAIADCEVIKSMLVGNHVVVFGRVARVALHPTELASPLLYGLRQYSSWALGIVGTLGRAQAGTQWLGARNDQF